MFLGEHQHSLDSKGRVILPSKFRARLSQGCVVTVGQDRCLYVFPPEEWARVAERLKDVKLSVQQARNFARLIFSGATEEVPDRQGRIGVPETLRRYAGLEREVAVIGVGERIELWDRVTWERHKTQTERLYAEITEANPDLPL